MTKTSELEEMKKEYVKFCESLMDRDNFTVDKDGYVGLDIFTEKLWSWIESHYTKGQQSLKVKKDR